MRKDGRTKVGGCSLVLGRLETGTSDRLDETQKCSYAVWLIAFNVGYRAMQVVLTGYGGKGVGRGDASFWVKHPVFAHDVFVASP